MILPRFRPAAPKPAAPPLDPHASIRATIAIMVDNEPGVLARVIGLFSGRGYNIESLTVAETDRRKNLSRITIVTSGTPMIIEQIKAQLGRLVPIHGVRDLTAEGPHLEQELALIKLAGTARQRGQGRRIAKKHRARLLDETDGSLVFELTGSTAELDSFIALLEPLGLVDVSRTGVVAISRGAARF
jgi:acetolactate synthase I/III small subunit